MLGRLAEISPGTLYRFCDVHAPEERQVWILPAPPLFQTLPYQIAKLTHYQNFELMETVKPFADMPEKFAEAWIGPLMDTGDGQLVMDSNHNRINAVISDDQDFATVHGIRFYTGNQKVIDTAKAVGKLVKPH